jgi:hypothetical protein
MLVATESYRIIGVERRFDLAGELSEGRGCGGTVGVRGARVTTRGQSEAHAGDLGAERAIDKCHVQLVRP